jgi:Zn-dependent protease
MQGIDLIFYIVILIVSVVIHEVCHGFAAEHFGDNTARDAGRLTLNPIKHIDIFGSIILPGLLILSKSPFLIGWAKPVPYNPDNLNDKRVGELAVASSGVLANFLIAAVFGLILRFFAGTSSLAGFDFVLSLIVVVNLGLAIFNLVPIPPLDGSKILFNLLPRRFYEFERTMETYSILILIIFIVYLSDYLFPIMAYLYKLITGFPLI